MNLASQMFALLAALLHVAFFGMESVWFMRPAVHRRFGAATAADATARRLFAYNQGFYNLFLAVGIFVGLVMLHRGGELAAAQTLVLFPCACMVAAGVVLWSSGGRRMLPAALIQAVPPLLAWGCWLMF